MFIDRPKLRGNFRRYLGRNYYILKRIINWNFSQTAWSRTVDFRLKGYTVFQHESLIRRPLKDVDMYLQENKRVNLNIAISKLNLTLINPGEVFSLWKLVGNPKKSKGYLEGLVLNQGKIEKGIGGGLCQLGNLLFWIIAHSPLTITERHRHSYDVFPDTNREIPFGAGATLSYNYIDFQFKNNTANTFQIILWMDDLKLHGELISLNKVESTFEVEEENHIMKQQIWGGYSRHNQIYKIEKRFNKEISKCLLAENHAIMMYNPFIEKK